MVRMRRLGMMVYPFLLASAFASRSVWWYPRCLNLFLWIGTGTRIASWGISIVCHHEASNGASEYAPSNLNE